MISGVIIRIKTWLTYFIIYSTIILGFFLWLRIFKVKKVSGLIKIYLTNTRKSIFSMNILSIGGLPPFLGFLGKLVIIKKIILIKLILSIRVLLMASFISLLYYIRICYSIFLASQNKVKKNTSIIKPMNQIPLWIRLFINTVAPLIVLLT